MGAEAQPYLYQPLDVDVLPGNLPEEGLADADMRSLQDALLRDEMNGGALATPGFGGTVDV